MLTFTDKELSLLSQWKYRLESGDNLTKSEVAHLLNVMGYSGSKSKYISEHGCSVKDKTIRNLSNQPLFKNSK